MRHDFYNRNLGHNLEDFEETSCNEFDEATPNQIYFTKEETQEASATINQP